MARASNGEGVTELVERELTTTHLKQASAKGPRLPHKHADETERGNGACLPGPQRGQTRRGLLQARYIRNKYSTERWVSLKEPMKIRTGRDSEKCPINSKVLSEPVVRFPNRIRLSIG